MAAESHKTKDHDTIKNWVVHRKGVPAKVKGTESGKGEGLLRIHFPEQSSDQDLQKISWDEFFEVFDKNNLTFLYQVKKENGEDSTFNKFVA
jgi:hypothetical protein